MKNIFHQILRGICVVIVIAIHSFIEPENLILKYFIIILRKIINFAVPLFIFLAGYYSKSKKSYKEYINAKIKRIIIPYLLWNMIYTLLFMFVNKDFSIFHNIHYIFDGTRISHMYYLLILFILYLLTPLLNKLSDKKNRIKYLVFIIPVIMNILYITIGYIENNAFELQKYNVLHWIGYYYLGIVTRKTTLKYNSKYFLNLSFVFLILSMLEGIFIYLNVKPFQLAISQCGIFNYFYSMSLILAMDINNNNNCKKCNILSKIGDYSYAIYLSHFLILLLVNKILSLITIPYIIFSILSFIITTIITYFICEIYYKMKGRFYIEKKN